LFQCDLGTQNTVNLVESGVNYSAMLSDDDKLIFYKEGLLHWAQRTFDLYALPEISGMTYPMEDV
jgi:hypothetical protein